MTSEVSIFQRRIDPVLQAGVVLAIVLVVDLFSLIIAGTNTVGVSNRFPWLCAASFMLFFALFNAVMSAAVPNTAKYWGRSLYSFMGLALGAGLLAWAFSGLTISEAGSYRWIYLVVTVGYLVFLGMISLIKNVVNFAQREEWNKPRPKNRRRED
ncbi:hypothetical protein [Lewinella sp. JB7]|uniref:hypothetical protein n=1 Tax=Lewinella sp. JB7 TaxID=2962887 RepID=UPI0020C9FF53|nr:hypothetical protein [Lewinella sp. JB7]MCP9235084.1 hypothetical protein [Lewinella sp. JB7]